MKVNDKAPEFTLPDRMAKGNFPQTVSRQIRSLISIRADTPGCTTHRSLQFRDSYKKMQKSGAILLGISPDTSKAQNKFAEKFDLPFILLADADKEGGGVLPDGEREEYVRQER